MHRSYGLQGSLKRRYKHPFPASINEYYTAKNVGIDYGRAKTYTVGNWLEVWYENYAKIKMRPSTYLTYHGYIENHIKPLLDCQLQGRGNDLMDVAYCFALSPLGCFCASIRSTRPEAGNRAAADRPQSGRRLCLAESGAQGNADASC